MHNGGVQAIMASDRFLMAYVQFTKQNCPNPDNAHGEELKRTVALTFFLLKTILFYGLLFQTASGWRCMRRSSPR